MVCAACSSEQVTRDAWAEWNVELQAWQLSAVFEFSFCHRCQSSTHLEERAMAAPRDA